MRQLLVLLLMIALGSPQVAAAMTSTNFSINWDSLNQGGNEAGTSTNFGIYDTVGGLATGTSTSATYQLSAGYRITDAAGLSLRVLAQDNSVRVPYSAFTVGTKTVTVSAVSGFIVGDYIAIVENLGFSQKVSVGKIASIAGTDFVLDALSGDQGTMSAAPTGGNDFVYLINGNAAAFGTVAATSESTEVSLCAVQAQVSAGYSVYVQGDSLLQNASAQPIATVTDGAVSLGSEEYGAATTGDGAVSAGIDLGVTTTQRIIQAKGAPSAAPEDRAALIYKIAITSATLPGSYHQSVSYTLTANY